MKVVEIAEREYGREVVYVGLEMTKREADDLRVWLAATANNGEMARYIRVLDAWYYKREG